MGFWGWFSLAVAIPFGIAANLLTPIVRRLLSSRSRPLFAGKWSGTVRYQPGRPHREDRYEAVFHGSDTEVCGILTCTKGSDSEQSFTLEGNFTNDVLSFVYSPTGSLARDRGTFVLRYKDAVHQKKLVGKAMFWSDALGEIDVAEVEFTLQV